MTSSAPLMDCVEISSPGGPQVLVPARRPRPMPRRGEVVIEVRAAGVNRPDALQRAGAYPPPAGASDLPGLEVAGVVAQLGDEVEGVRVGDKVCALTPGGGYAQFCATPATQCLPIPKDMDFVAAAAVPETYFTVWFNLFMQAGLRKGDTLLQHGGASGIGTTAIQLARQFGCDVIATAGSEEKLEVCRGLGAQLAIDYRSEDFVAQALQHTNGRGVDVVCDMVGAPYLQRDIEALAPGGRLVLIAFLAGSKAQVDFMPVMRKSLVVTGSTLRPQPVEVKARIAVQLREQVWPLLEGGQVAPRIFATLPLAQASQAHAMMEAGRIIGKVVLEV